MNDVRLYVIDVETIRRVALEEPAVALPGRLRNTCDGQRSSVSSDCLQT
jgi:hypothetical protein